MPGAKHKTTTGGDWKELVRASTEGDLALIRYHLDTGIDPNFQHPEFMTTPLLEAVKLGQKDAVETLLGHHRSNRADPTVAGDWEGTTPLEEAVNGKFHGVVDVLLRSLPEGYDASGECLAIWITTTMAHRHQDLIAHLLDAGHAVVVATTTTTNEAAGSSSEQSSLVESLRAKTGNRKFWMIPVGSAAGQKDFFDCAAAPDDKTATANSNEWRPAAIDVWLHHVAQDDDSSGLLVADFASQLNRHRDAAVVPFRGARPKVVFLVDSKAFAGRAGNSVQQQLARLLNRCSSSSNNDSGNDKTILPASCCAILEPTTWWDKMTYSFWNQTWHESVTKLLESMAAQQRGEEGVGESGARAEGTVFAYDGKRLSIPSSSDGGIVESAIVDEWEKEFDNVVDCNKNNIRSSL